MSGAEVSDMVCAHCDAVLVAGIKVGEWVSAPVHRCSNPRIIVRPRATTESTSGEERS